MKRRDLLGGLAVLAMPHADASKKVLQLGVLTPARREWDKSGQMRGELRSLGLVEGSNLSIVVRYAGDDPGRFRDGARELVALKVDAILTNTTVGTRAATEATKTIPIITHVADPITSGFATSYRSPGGNVTGLSEGQREEFSKRLELMRALVPKMRELVVFLHPIVVLALSELYKGAAREAGVSVRIVVANRPEQVLEWLDKTKRGSEPAGFVIDRLESPEVARRAIEVRMALTGWTDRWVDSGGLFLYRQYHTNGTRRMAALVAAVLRGADPSRIPFELPDVERLEVNRATARALGIELPRDVVVRTHRFVD